MKRLFLSMLLIIPIFISAQENWVYSEVVEVKDVTANELHLRCQAWFATYFKDSRNVLVSDNLETGIIANGSIKVEFKSGFMVRTGHVKYRMEIYFKDGRYKFEFKDFFHIDTNGTNYPGEGGSLLNEKPECGTFNLIMKDWRTIKEITKTEMSNLIESLKLKMTSPLESKKDNW